MPFGKPDDKNKKPADEKDKKKGNPFAGREMKKPPFDKDKNPAPKDSGKDGSKKPPFGKDGKKPPFGKKDGQKPGKGNPEGEKTEEPEIKDKVKVNFKPEITREELEYIFEGDLSDQEEYQEIVEQTLEEINLNEITISDRLRRRATMRRSRQRIKLGRARALRRRATTAKITGRARRSAIQTIKSRFSGNRKPEDLSFSEKDRLERLVARRKKMVGRVTRKLIRTKRELERHRMAGTPAK